jgi:flagellar M-ring protein FliF
MGDWRQTLARLTQNLAAVPKIFWAAGAAILVSLGVAMWFELSGPPYAVLQEGLSPADGGKVIAELQKLGIPYQLQAAGNIILVPAPQLAQARLQLGQLQVPGSDVQTAWSQLENAPMTASDLAQSTMAQQALQLSLQQSIQSMNGIRSAQVFLALPQETPFLADQPKPAASVVIEADPVAAQTQGQAIANLVSGAVPGLAANDVTVQTTSGTTVFPAGGAMNTGTQLQTAGQVEAVAAARVAALLIPLVGAGNFQTDVSANLDFTQEHIHQISYGPDHIISHQILSQSMNMDGGSQAIGIPGALSNEPPQATTAAQPANTAQAGVGNTGTGTVASSEAGKSNAPAQPRQSSSNTDQTYVVNESDADITNPDWSVKSMAISVVLDKAALKGPVTVDQVKTAIAGAFAYPNVSVNILAASFQKQPNTLAAAPLMAAVPPVAQALLEVMAAAALLFGFAVPAGKRLAAFNINAYLPPPLRPMPVVLPPRDFSDLRDQAAENIPGVARLLQNWAEDNE